MKRGISILLAIVMMVMLCACGSGDAGTAGTAPATTGAAEEKTAFMAGFARVDITPQEMGVSLRGFGDEKTRLSTDVISYIYSDCLALRDEEGNTALIISLDLCSCNSQQEIREAVKSATGVPLDHIVTSCSHQHSTPNDVYAREWLQFLLKQVSKSAQSAIADLAPATMEIATVQTERLNFVRHYIMNDGTYAGDNFGSTASGYKAHVSQADGSMQLVKFVREGEKKDILLTNFQGHPHLGSMTYYTSIHSDTVGVYRDAVSAALGCETIYFSGAGGNVKMKSAIEEENLTTDFREHGKLLSQYAIKAEGSYTPIATGAVRAVQEDFVGTVDHTEDHLVDLAKKMVAAYQESGSNSHAMQLAGNSGISSWHHAKAIVTKSELGSTSTIENLGAIAVGDLAFVAAPYEMFDSNGVYIKENSPFKMTVVCTIANGGNGYMPSKPTFAYNGYEADTSKFVEGTAEALADKFLEMLNGLHG